MMKPTILLSAIASAVLFASVACGGAAEVPAPAQPTEAPAAAAAGCAGASDPSSAAGSTGPAGCRADCGDSHRHAKAD